jgi:hypothetical protein
MSNETPSIFDADTVHVAQAMKSGGGFMTALSDALIRADSRNRLQILNGWEEEITHEWERYYRNH